MKFYNHTSDGKQEPELALAATSVFPYRPCLGCAKCTPMTHQPRNIRLLLNDNKSAEDNKSMFYIYLLQVALRSSTNDSLGDANPLLKSEFLTFILEIKCNGGESEMHKVEYVFFLPCIKSK